MSIRAIDVSHWQGPIDWAAVKASGVQGVWVKVGGADAGQYKDPMAETYMAGVASIGLPYGTYYYCDTRSSAAGQAAHAVSCGHGRGQLWPAADLEENLGGLSNEAMDVWLATFCDEVRRLTGRESIWYGNLQAGAGYTTRAPGCPVWIANYGRVDTPGTTPPSWSPPVPPAYPGWDIWQFNSSTRVPGIPGNTCDQDAVSDELWERMTHPAPKEQLMTKAIRVPDDNPNLWWQVVRDGNGKLRRCAMTANDTIGLTFAGELDGTADLKRGVTGFGIDQGSIVDWLYALPTDPPAGVFEEITGEEMRIIAYLRDEILPKIGPPTLAS